MLTSIVAAAADWQQALLDFMRSNTHLTEVVVFLLGFAESMVFISLLVPSTVIFLALGGLHSAAGGEFWPVWLAASAGAFIGDVITYAIGRRYKEGAANVWPMTRYPGLIPKGQVMFARWGVASIIIGKFVGMLRPFIPLVAGIALMRAAAFVPASAVSSLVWAGVCIAPGYGIVLIAR
jgi:membrane protein DedA with SNARE-associated domain